METHFNERNDQLFTNSSLQNKKLFIKSRLERKIPNRHLHEQICFAHYLLTSHQLQIFLNLNRSTINTEDTYCGKTNSYKVKKVQGWNSTLILDSKLFVYAILRPIWYYEIEYCKIQKRQSKVVILGVGGDLLWRAL